MASAAAAACEKIRAGENRAIEHVAYHDDIAQSKGRKRSAAAAGIVGTGQQIVGILQNMLKEVSEAIRRAEVQLGHVTR